MQNFHQFVPLSDNEITEINGGALTTAAVAGIVIAAVLLAAGLGGGAAVAIAEGAGEALVLTGSGVQNIGMGVNNLLTNL